VAFGTKINGRCPLITSKSLKAGREDSNLQRGVLQDGFQRVAAGTGKVTEGELVSLESE